MVLTDEQMAAVGPLVRDAARDELALTRLAPFMRQAWPILEPARPLVWNWHYDVLCAELERVARGELRELVICVPPGTGKSIVVQAVFLAWMWLQRPEERVLVCSANDRPVTHYAIRTRDLVRSAWYQGRIATMAKRGIGLVRDERGELVPWSIRPDQDAKVNYANTAGGLRVGATMGGAVIGDRYDGIIVDDPMDAKAALLGSPSQIEERMETIAVVYDDVLKKRLDPMRGWRIVIMQRLHEHDLAALRMSAGAHAVVIDMEMDPAGATWRHPGDRRQLGELMFQARFTPAWWAAEKADPRAARSTAAQYQQRPTPVAGQLFKRGWTTQRYQGDPQRFARGLDEVALTIDCAFKGLDTSDYVVIQVWGRKGTAKYLLDQVRARMDIVATIQAIAAMTQKWARARLKLIELKANGDGVVSLLRGRVPGLIGYEPTMSKYARAQAASIAWEASEVYLPEPEWAPWIGDFVEEHVSFPGGANDDQVDAMSQLFDRWDNGGSDALERVKAMAGILGGR